MSLIKNKESGNFYPKVVEGTDWHCDYLWSTHGCNPCPFGCVYCSSTKLYNRFKNLSKDIRRLKGEWIDVGGLLEPIRLVRLLPGAGIFVNPYCDMFALAQYDIGMILVHCNDEMTRKQNPKLDFIFQTKDPAKYFDYLELIPEGSWLGTTIETDDITLYTELSISKAPTLANRLYNMTKLKKENKNYKYFVTIEPIMKSYGSCNYGRFIFWMQELCPDFIFIGANTSKVNLPEPSPDEIMDLIESLRMITVVHLKSNLKRLLQQ